MLLPVRGPSFLQMIHKLISRIQYVGMNISDTLGMRLASWTYLFVPSCYPVGL